jgi:hypothetical protein
VGGVKKVKVFGDYIQFILFFGGAGVIKRGERNKKF